MFLHKTTKIRAPEFPKDLTWLNSSPLTLASLRGKVILLDFWTYSCVNCLRTEPFLKRLWKTYSEHGLVIIGIHTPEFIFEKDPANVLMASQDRGLDYPIVLDPDYKIWHLYANRFWPRKMLVNKDGYVVYDHVGEGGYAETELAIQKCLMEIGVKNLGAIGPDDSVAGSVCYRTTPETYLGYLRGNIGNLSDILPETEEAFTDSSGQEADRPYLHGHFSVSGEYIEHTRNLPLPSEYISLRYSAFSVNLVMGSADGSAHDIEVELDGQPLSEDMIGRDVRITSDGRAVVVVKEPRMYNLVKADFYHRGQLKLKIKSAHLRFFAFTFGGCLE